MTILFNSNWDSDTPGTLPSSVTPVYGASPNIFSTNAVSSPNALGFGGLTNGSWGMFLGLPASSSMAIRSDQVAVFSNNQLNLIAHILRGNNSPIPFGYIVNMMSTDGVNIYASVNAQYGGGNRYFVSSNLITAVNGDILHFETYIVGDTITGYLWKNSDPKPETPSFTTSGNSYFISPGYAGFRKEAPTADDSTITFDNIVITDAAGGEDFYQPKVITQPNNISVTSPAPAIFSTTVSNNPTSYQWQISTDDGNSWNNVSTGSGGTTSSYTTSPTSSGDDGNQYRCIVANGAGGVTTSSAILTVSSPGTTNAIITNFLF